jgi:hypothetical protein
MQLRSDLVVLISPSDYLVSPGVVLQILNGSALVEILFL